MTAISLLAASAGVKADAGRQSFESCSLITGEYVTVLQLLSRGFSRDTLKQTLPDISEQAAQRLDSLARMAESDGLIESYSTIYSEYARCSKRVYDKTGLPVPGSREAHFYRCAGESKVGYEIAIAAVMGAGESDVIDQLDSSLKPKAKTLFREFQANGKLSLFDTLANDLKDCLASIP
ncbi:hypothetical protein [Marinobacter sp. CHS3-4]|uniref:hypothetical protein n=1 Tax=Marinobacter sp. CHS3-4 TaxID=3045174 RepID=UPI0024B4CC76|nr:hypothetical protein [Marinobacter sp. CHS3-4]MDI9245233.1 hypothetical protein [Marinobacter sp. CHS3-4]